MTEDENYKLTANDTATYLREHLYPFLSVFCLLYARELQPDEKQEGTIKKSAGELYDKAIEELESRPKKYEVKDLDHVMKMARSHPDTNILWLALLEGYGSIGFNIWRLQRYLSEIGKGCSDSPAKAVERATNSIEKGIERDCNDYLRGCAEFKTIPSLEMLGDVSGKSKAYWSKKLKDVFFLTLLLKRLESKLNQAKTGEKKELWIRVKGEIDDKLNSLRNPLRGSRQYNDNIGGDSEDSVNNGN